MCCTQAASCFTCPDLFFHDFCVIALPIRITRLSSEGTTSTHTTEPTFSSPLSRVPTLTLHSVGQ
ncbi:hypothetical protein CSKR_101739 [Clonorchis sinensis]|uniref:Uncharacterized protein n=1 Tax=Clonorchis sinensis TaxID=79923 RepID=A0A419PHP9_CLOSI|nr:hypothetical protein CSKR_101739 [Clonorchis sinensis]